MAPWWAENSKEAYSSGLANLATALGNSERVEERHPPGAEGPVRRGSRAHDTAVSCRFTTGAFGLPAADRRHVKLPRIAPGAHPRVDPHARPACRPRHRSYPLGHRHPPGRTLVLLVLVRGSRVVWLLRGRVPVDGPRGRGGPRWPRARSRPGC